MAIGAYCYETFKVILGHLQDISASTKLVSHSFSINQLIMKRIFLSPQNDINYCFLILIELIELICLSAGKCTLSAIHEYRINKILADLIQFLQNIRNTTQNYRFNENRIQRNNSISIIYLICRLAMFKENADQNELIGKNLSDCGTSQYEYNPKQFQSSLNNTNYSSDYGGSQCESFVSAFENTYQLKSDLNDSIWAHELEIALLDYSLKHFYPDVYELIALTLKVSK